MRSEGSGKLKFKSRDFLRGIRRFMAALITLDIKWATDRQRFKGISLGQRNLMVEKDVRVAMGLSVLADHHPAVVDVSPRGVRPHSAASNISLEDRARCGL
jgi:hypothetical protein